MCVRFIPVKTVKLWIVPKNLLKPCSAKTLELRFQSKEFPSIQVTLGYFICSCLFRMEIISLFLYYAEPVIYNLQLESCPKWTDKIENSEASMFLKSPEYMNMVSQISKRLGFLDNITDGEYWLLLLWLLVSNIWAVLIAEIIHAMYESCRYNKALVLESYPAWCGLFTRQELQVRFTKLV